MAYTVNDVANMLGVNGETVRRWIREGKIPAERNLGRGGNSVKLSDVIAFANQPPKTYLSNVTTWLDEHGIAYEKVSDSSEESTTKNDKKVAKTMTGIATALAPLAMINPVVGAVGAASAAGVTAAVASVGVATGRRKKKCPTYSVKLIPPCDDNELTPDLHISDSQNTQATEDKETLSSEATVSSSEDISAPDTTSNQTDLEAKILEEQMKLIKLRQELAQIQAKIAVSEGEVEYYKLLLKQ